MDSNSSDSDNDSFDTSSSSDSSCIEIDPTIEFLCGKTSQKVTLNMSQLTGDNLFILYEQVYKCCEVESMKIPDISANGFKAFIKCATDKEPSDLEGLDNKTLLEILDLTVRYEVEELRQQVIDTLVSATNVTNVVRFYDKSVSLGEDCNQLRTHTLQFMAENAYGILKSKAIFNLSDKSFECFLNVALSLPNYNKITLYKLLTKWWEAQDDGRVSKTLPDNLVEILHLEAWTAEEVTKFLSPTAPRFLTVSKVNQLLLDSHSRSKPSCRQVVGSNGETFFVLEGDDVKKEPQSDSDADDATESKLSKTSKANASGLITEERITEDFSSYVLQYDLTKHTGLSQPLRKYWELGITMKKVVNNIVLFKMEHSYDPEIIIAFPNNAFELLEGVPTTANVDSLTLIQTSWPPTTFPYHSLTKLVLYCVSSTYYPPLSDVLVEAKHLEELCLWVELSPSPQNRKRRIILDLMVAGKMKNLRKLALNNAILTISAKKSWSDPLFKVLTSLYLDSVYMESSVLSIFSKIFWKLENLVLVNIMFKPQIPPSTASQSFSSKEVGELPSNVKKLAVGTPKRLLAEILKIRVKQFTNFGINFTSGEGEIRSQHNTFGLSVAQQIPLNLSVHKNFMLKGEMLWRTLNWQYSGEAINELQCTEQMLKLEFDFFNMADIYKKLQPNFVQCRPKQAVFKQETQVLESEEYQYEDWRSESAMDI